MTETQGAKPAGRGKVYDSITETIGDTPIVKLSRVAREKGVHAELLAKPGLYSELYRLQFSDRAAA